VANSQAVEHYEISRYGTLMAWAEELRHDNLVRLLTTTLNGEKAANTKLNNGRASQGRKQEGFCCVGADVPYTARKAQMFWGFFFVATAMGCNNRRMRAPCPPALALKSSRGCVLLDR
jgi:Domain of unknown function (DUF892)